MKIFSESEKSIQQAIMQYLRFKGYFVMRLNSGSIQTEKGFRVRLSEPGTPDLMAFKESEADMAEWGLSQEGNVYLLFIEVKTKKGKVTFLQEQKMQELEEYGAKCMIIHSVEELQERRI